MKTQHSPFLQNISEQDVETLTQEVKETVSGQAHTGTTLSSAQLWNIQRRGRKFSHSRGMIS